jgi:uncharacterized protein YutD
MIITTSKMSHVLFTQFWKGIAFGDFAVGHLQRFKIMLLFLLEKEKKKKNISSLENYISENYVYLTAYFLF